MLSSGIKARVRFESYDESFSLLGLKRTWIFFRNSRTREKFVFHILIA